MTEQEERDANVQRHLDEPNPMAAVRAAAEDATERGPLVMLAVLVTIGLALQTVGIGLLLLGQRDTHGTQRQITECTTPGTKSRPHACYDGAEKRTAAAVSSIVGGIVAGLRAPPPVIILPETTTTTTTVPSPAPRSAPTTTPRSTAAPSSTPATTTTAPPGPNAPPAAQACVRAACVTIPNP